MSSERVSTNDIKKTNVKRKVVEEEEHSAELLLSLKDGRSITINESSSQKMSAEGTKLVLQEERKQLPCRFCDKKFPNSQSLGGHQNAHKNERKMMKMEKEIEAKAAFRFGHENVHLRPYSFYNGVNMMNPTAQPHNLGMTSSWSGGVPTSQWRLNTETLWQQMHALAQNGSKSASASASSSASVGIGFSGLQGSLSASRNPVEASSSAVQGSPSLSNEDPPAEELDLTLKL